MYKVSGRPALEWLSTLVIPRRQNLAPVLYDLVHHYVYMRASYYAPRDLLGFIYASRIMNHCGKYNTYRRPHPNAEPRYLCSLLTVVLQAGQAPTPGDMTSSDGVTRVSHALVSMRKLSVFQQKRNPSRRILTVSPRKCTISWRESRHSDRLIGT